MSQEVLNLSMQKRGFVLLSKILLSSRKSHAQNIGKNVGHILNFAPFFKAHPYFIVPVLLFHIYDSTNSHSSPTLCPTN